MVSKQTTLAFFLVAFVCLIQLGKSRHRHPAPIAPPIEVCIFERRVYNVGEKFVDSKCTMRCTCHRKNRVACSSLCPPSTIRCQSNQTLTQKIVPAGPKNQCFCSRSICVDNIDV
ncbi:hypothetical protein AC249_AIPGENE8505 [Exaiptasia diaphana]|nr:hypothetical protein AC249_AIPGENE8505 [Exaiptasia diaphana]